MRGRFWIASDRGEDWAAGDLGATYPRAVTFADPSFGWAVCWMPTSSSGVILSTMDGGASWSKSYGRATTPDLHDIACASEPRRTTTFSQSYHSIVSTITTTGAEPSPMRCDGLLAQARVVRVAGRAPSSGARPPFGPCFPPAAALLEQWPAASVVHPNSASHDVMLGSDGDVEPWIICESVMTAVESDGTSS